MRSTTSTSNACSRASPEAALGVGTNLYAMAVPGQAFGEVGDRFRIVYNKDSQDPPDSSKLSKIAGRLHTAHRSTVIARTLHRIFWAEPNVESVLDDRL